MSGSQPQFVLVSSLTASRFDDDSVSISRKFMSGVEAHQKEWPGSVLVIMAPASQDGNNLDYVRIQRKDLPFELKIMSLKDPALRGVVRGASLVFLMLYHRQFRLAKICRDVRVPFIYTSEYTLKTRLQIIESQELSPLKKNLKILVERYREMRAKLAVKLATGIQSNGVPTFKEYSAINPNTMLFYDTRITLDMLAGEEAIHRRLEERQKSGVLRLAFSGRLIKMKGADHLVRVAKALKLAGKKFTMTICGDGDLRESIERDIQAAGLENVVCLKGVMDFESELVPFVRDNVDIFVCCHRQGDPSCTYLETLSCGVPIAGYANEAFVGLHAESAVGWVTAMDEPEELAKRLIGLSDADIRQHSLRAIEFAKTHTFEAEFSRRMAHARRLSLGEGENAAI